MSLDKTKLDSTDFLGRSVSDQTRAKFAHNNEVLHFRSLLPSSGKHVISVDKLIRDATNNNCTYTDIHVRIANERKGIFFGWGYLTLEALERNTPCKVELDPILANPNHVLVIYPNELKSDKNELKYIAKDIALLTKWLEVKDPTSLIIA